MNHTSQVEVINAEINRQLANAEVGRALLATTFKGLNATSMKQAIMEGMVRGFSFKDFLEKNVYAIPYGQGYSLVTSIDFARKRGMRSGIVGKGAPIFEMEGEGKSRKVISCSVTVRRKVDTTIGDFTATVYFDEYTTGKNLWISKPRTMLAKVAEMHALRMACPEGLSQMYTEDEMGSGALHVEAKPMEPYEVKRVAPVAEDEAGGSGAKVEERHEEAAATPKEQLAEILDIMETKFKMKLKLPKDEEKLAEGIMNLTGIKLVEENYQAVINELKSL